MPREFQGPSRAASKLFEIGLLTSGARVDTPAPPGCSTQVWPRCARPLPSLPCPALVPALVELPALTEAVLLSESLLRDSDCVSCALGEDTSALGGRTNPEGRSARAPCAGGQSASVPEKAALRVPMGCARILWSRRLGGYGPRPYQCRRSSQPGLPHGGCLALFRHSAAAGGVWAGRRPGPCQLQREAAAFQSLLRASKSRCSFSGQEGAPTLAA